MRILFVANAYPPAISGVAISTANFRQALEKLGHQVWVIAPRYPNYKDSDSRILRTATIPNPIYPQYPLALFFLRKKLINKLRQEKIQLVHTMQPFSIGKFSYRLSQRLNVPLVFHHHTRYDIYSHYIPLLPKRWSQKMVVKSVKKLMNKSSAIISPSLSIKQFIVKQNINKPIYVVPTGLTKSFKSSLSKEQLRKKLNLPTNTLIILIVSRISIKDKNLLMLLDAYKNLYKNIRPSKLVMVGGGPGEKQLKEEVKKRKLEKEIILVGYIPNKDVFEYYSAADIFTNPSISETQGLISLEALSAGIPVVAPLAPGNKDFIQNGQNGFLTKNDPLDFAKKIKHLADDQDLRQKLSLAAQASAKQYTSLNMAKRLLRAYSEILAKT